MCSIIMNSNFHNACDKIPCALHICNQYRGGYLVKKAKTLTAIVLGCSLLFLMCSCSNEPAKTDEEEINESAESETEETEDEKTDGPMIVGGGNTDFTIDPTAETIIDEYGIAQTRLPSSELGSILGFDNCYCEGYMDVIGHCNWTIYNGDGEEIACQFGFGCEDAPDFYVADLDGDGENELICNCTYGADGTQRVFVFRNNAGIIEVGRFDENRMASELGEELYALSYNEFYDEAQNSIVFAYTTGNEYSISLDDFSFSRYVP